MAKISTEFGQNPNYFGRIDYEENLKRGVSSQEMLDFVLANPQLMRGNLQEEVREEMRRNAEIEKKKKELEKKPTKSLTAVNQYKETITDADKQYYRDLLLGLTKEDKAITELSEKASEKYQQQFGALSQQVLGETVKQIKKQQKKEYEFNLIKGMPGLNEIFGINESLSNSILGDSGLGGYLSMMGGGSQEDIEKAFAKKLGLETGISTQNATSYNWQKWFDEQLTEEAQKLGTDITTEELQEQKKFAEDYINTYLRPRFDFSRSMGEFESYLRTDVSSPEFQKEVIDLQKIQEVYNGIAEKRNEQFLTELSGQPPSGFDPEFYFSPFGNDTKENAYSLQRSKVNLDWDTAKKGGTTDGINWKKEALAYGVDLNNRQQFAKLHYELYGRNNNFDGAKDALTKDAVKQYISNVLIPTLKETDIDMKTNPFKDYVSPDEFADGILGSLTGNRSWDQYISDVLGVKPPTPIPSNASEEAKEKYNTELAAYESRLESIKEQVGEDPLNEIKNSLVGFYLDEGEGSIRQQIKKLQEENIVPTQEKLGITYIERAEDTSTKEKKSTALYQLFKSSGYQGDEDTFYTEMFPDVNREEQELMTDVLSGKANLLESFSFSDPFSFDPDKIFSKMSFFEEKEKEKEAADKDTYFTLDKGIGTGQVTKQPKNLYSDFDSSFSQFGFF